MRRLSFGFSLVELMVTITIIGILAAIVYANIGAAGPKARNAERQADLRNLQSAIQLYKNKYGTYPSAGCAVVSGTWAYEDSCPVYISGLAPEFMSVLPHDDYLSAGARGYSYMTNANRTVYKIATINNVESEVVSSNSAFKRCEGGVICAATGVCDSTSVAYQKTYALWGGYADGATDADVKTATAVIICQ